MIDLKAANHTNRELELMLAGRKSLSVFCDEISCLPNEWIIPEDRFRPYVVAGTMVREEVNVPTDDYLPKLGRNATLRYVLFAMRDEAWRIPAYLMVKRVFRRMDRYTEEIERMESELLGYTSVEVDAYCDFTFRRKPNA